MTSVLDRPPRLSSAVTPSSPVTADLVALSKWRALVYPCFLATSQAEQKEIRAGGVANGDKSRGRGQFAVLAKHRCPGFTWVQQPVALHSSVGFSVTLHPARDQGLFAGIFLP